MTPSVHCKLTAADIQSVSGLKVTHRAVVCHPTTGNHYQFPSTLQFLCLTRSKVIFQLISFSLNSEASQCPRACFRINVSSRFGLKKEKPATCSSSESLNQYFTCRSDFPLTSPVLSSSLHPQLRVFQTLGGDRRRSVAAVLSAAQRDFTASYLTHNLHVGGYKCHSSGCFVLLYLFCCEVVLQHQRQSVLQWKDKNLNSILFRMTFSDVL